MRAKDESQIQNVSEDLTPFDMMMNGLLNAEVRVNLVERYNNLRKDEALKTDEATGKAISSAKADVITSASPEASIYKQAKMHIENLEMLIQSAKSLQRGLIQEMTHGNLN